MAFVRTKLLENVDGERSYASYSRRTLLHSRLRDFKYSEEDCTLCPSEIRRRHCKDYRMTRCKDLKLIAFHSHLLAIYLLLSQYFN